jgi:hypothetical protein
MDLHDLLTRDPIGLDPEMELHAGLGETVRHLGAGELLQARHEPGLGFDQGDSGPEGGVRLGELGADGPAAEHDQAARHLRGGRGLPVGPGVDLGEALDGRYGRNGPRCHHDRLRRYELLVGGPDAPLALEARLAADQLDPMLLEPRELRRVVAPADHLVAAGEHRRDVDVAPHGLRRPGDPAHLRQGLGGAQERLRGHARVVGALASDQVALDDRNREPPVGKPPRAHLARRARAEHHHVELPGAHVPELRRGAG